VLYEREVKRKAEKRSRINNVSDTVLQIESELKSKDKIRKYDA
jgi:hypothetical protein